MKTKPVMPSAISGKEYYDVLCSKQQAKAEEQEKKRKRKEERELKKKMNEGIKKKQRIGNKGDEGEEGEDTEEDCAVVFDDESSIDDNMNECQACGRDDEKDDAAAWIGCQKCPRWFHKWCINDSYSALSIKDIAKLDFTCFECEKRIQRQQQCQK